MVWFVQGIWEHSWLAGGAQEAGGGVGFAVGCCCCCPLVSSRRRLGGVGLDWWLGGKAGWSWYNIDVIGGVTYSYDMI